MCVVDFEDGTVSSERTAEQVCMMSLLLKY